MIVGARRRVEGVEGSTLFSLGSVGATEYPWILSICTRSFGNHKHDLPGPWSPVGPALKSTWFTFTQRNRSHTLNSDFLGLMVYFEISNYNFDRLNSQLCNIIIQRVTKIKWEIGVGGHQCTYIRFIFYKEYNLLLLFCYSVHHVLTFLKISIII